MKLEGMIEDIVFRNDDNGWTVTTFKPDSSGRMTAVGILPFLKTGDRVELEGEMTEHKEYGPQLKVIGYELKRPETASAIEKYLASGVIKGIGPATAKMIVRKYGKDALDILENSPHRLTELPGIGPKKAAMIAESFSEQNESRTTMIFLQNLGLSAALAMKTLCTFGEQCESIIRRDPYRLANEIEGIGFKTADEIAMNMGFSVNSPERLASGVNYVLNEAVSRMGHMYLPFDELARMSVETLGISREAAEINIRQLVHKERLIMEKIGEVSAIYLPGLNRAERKTAELLLQLASAKFKGGLSGKEAETAIERYEIDHGVLLSEKQKEAVTAAVSRGIVVITGGPGTGKTTSINCVLELLSDKKTELCAPTGRAAKRMSEATGREARTIHRMLEYSGETESFMKNEDAPIDAEVIIVDEMSMVDIFLMRSLLMALRRGTRLILVGDADQLPSVGAGNVLRDIIASGALPVVCLDRIFRQGQQSCIVTNAHRINHGEYPEIRTRDTDFFLERKNSAAEVAASVTALVKKRLPGYLGIDPLTGIQVMAPMKKGALGVLQLNQVLQAELNPARETKAELKRADCVFRVGDKVMQVRNNYDIEWKRGAAEKGEGVFNGDIGYIREIDREEKIMLVEFDDGRRVEYDDSMLDELELSYCISVHKSQGSEFDAVVLPLFNGPMMLMCRNLLYTAVTRAKRLVVIVGREECVWQMVDNNRILQRYSALDTRLKERVKR